MTALLLAPHNDDETLFAAFTVARERPDVVVCYRSAMQVVQGVSAEERERETSAALRELGVDEYAQWETLDSARDEEAAPPLLDRLRTVDQLLPYDRVYAPAIEDGGHQQHNLVGNLAREVFGDRVVHYLTYTGGRARSTSANEVEPEPDWIAAKLCALACYRSQHRLWSTAHHFLAAQNEYLA